MPIGDPGEQQFRDLIPEMRNQHVAVGLAPLMLLREELVANDDLTDRGGMDTPSKDHFLQLLDFCDVSRRQVTHNPDGADLKVLITKAIDTKEKMEVGENPLGGDDIQMGSGGLYQLPWAFDGTDVDIPLNNDLRLKSGNGRILLGAIDKAIVAWTRLNSRERTRFITRFDSMRVYGHYQQILQFLNIFAGDENRVDVAQMLASDEPRGPGQSPNRKTEAVGEAQTQGE